MIHPRIELIFTNNKDSIELFSWICSKINNIKKLEEFIKWHLEVNKEVVKEITRTQEINFSNDVEAKKWASEFLDAYDEKIRWMRNTSNLIFQRFHYLKNNEFQNIISENVDYKDRVLEMMQVFLNKKELLIGKIIFAYRELWFLANHILNPKFKLGSILKYEEWVYSNISNLKKINNSLKLIQKEIKNREEGLKRDTK